MNTYMYLMAQDIKWMQRTQNLAFAPFPGMSFDGLAGEQPLRVATMSYDVALDAFKINLAWLSQQPMTSDDLLALDVGWAIKT